MNTTQLLFTLVVSLATLVNAGVSNAHISEMSNLYRRAFSPAKARTFSLAGLTYSKPYEYESAYYTACDNSTADDSDVEAYYSSITCPRIPPLVCNPKEKWRSINGSCNNLLVSWWGQSFTFYKRLCKHNYEDCQYKPRRTGKSRWELPNARKVATHVHYSKERLKDLSHMFVMFGQFLMHDITKLGHTLGKYKQIMHCECYSTSSDCINVKLSKYDRLFWYGGNQCLSVIRERDSREDFDCDLGHREQTNEATSWVDLSSTYGSTLYRAKELRTYVAGKLKVVYRSNPDGPLLPSECTYDMLHLLTYRHICFVAGDDRVNSHALLASIQTIMVRYHNYLATELAKVNKQWNDEELYQEARRLNIAIFQHIAYDEWLPWFIGPELHKAFGLASEESGYFLGYSDKAFGNVAIEFAGAAARIGHALVAPYVSLVDDNNYILRNISLHKTLFNMALVAKDDQLTQLMRGSWKDLAWQYPPHVNEELLDWLVVDHGNKNPSRFHSLPTINVQRGRDLGLCFYNKYRRLAGLKPLKSFKEYDWIPEKNAKNLAKVYKYVEDVELFSGGLSEYPVRQGVVGPTLGYILAVGFREWKYGDRWWYENPAAIMPYPFTSNQLKTIRQMTFASVLCSTLDIKKVTSSVFLKEDYENPEVPCNRIYPLNFNAFKDSGANFEAATVQTAAPAPAPVPAPDTYSTAYGATAAAATVQAAAPSPAPAPAPASVPTSIPAPATYPTAYEATAPDTIPTAS